MDEEDEYSSNVKSNENMSNYYDVKTWICGWMITQLDFFTIISA